MRKEEVLRMRDNYDFSAGKKNPYASQLKKQITINIDTRVIDYFKKLAEKTSIPYQSLINLYLLDCAKNNKEINILWK